MLTQFSTFNIERAGVRLHGKIGGQGAPLLLLHGHPQSHVIWHRVAPKLAERFTLVMMDLRGYGDSARPAGDAMHTVYSKREMALDALAVMQHHSFDRFQVLAHDRGARVAHRLAMYENTSQAFATAYWHWFFLIQPPPLPEALIESDPVRYLRSVMGKRHAGLAAFAPEALAEYERCVQIADTAQSICEDYRASITVDLAHDRADVATNQLLAQPLRVLWGEHGAVGQCFDVLALWRARALQVSGRALSCGHYIAEEDPAALLAEAFQFFQE